MVRNVAKLVTLAPVRRIEIQPLSPHEISGFLDALEDDPLGPLYLTALATGLRQGELLGLTWDDVDLDRGWLSVRRQLQRINGEYTLSMPKSEAESAKNRSRERCTRGARASAPAATKMAHGDRAFLG